MIGEGADILDIGACSTRPGALEPDMEMERSRLEQALSIIRADYPDILLSVDTYRSEIAEWAISAYNVQIINDISGGEMDPRMFSVIASHKVIYILMHMLGTPRTMQQNPLYNDVTGDVIKSLARRVIELERAGVADIWIDPGFGFGKLMEDNYALLDDLQDFRIFERPLVVGLSRKSMIYKSINSEPEAALNGTSVLHTVALIKNADILRVHDVKQAVECILLTDKAKTN
jgi:dihydropteroate synthase